MSASKEESDDDMDLEGMMDVDFPGGENDSDDDRTSSSPPSSTSPTVDIEKNGWDDDAITSCWDLTLFHYGNVAMNKSEDVESIKEKFTFVPKINRRLDENGQVLSLPSCTSKRETAPIKGAVDSINGEVVQEESENNRWRPQGLNLPKWAEIPDTQ